MINKYFLSLVIGFCALTFGFGQTTVIDFETAGAGYTPSTTIGSGWEDVFNRSNFNMSVINNEDGYYWAVEDINGSPHLDIDQIDVTGASSFDFSIDWIAHHYNDWDANTEVNITYSIDGNPYQNLIWVRNICSCTNAPAAVDLGFDGTGDCGSTTTLPSRSTGSADGCTVSSTRNQFETYVGPNISLSGNSTLDIRISFAGFSQTDQGIYLDNITIDVQGGASTPTITVSPTTISNLDYTFGSGPSSEDSFEVSGTNLTGDINLNAPANFEIATSAAGPYTSSLTLSESSGSVGNTTIYTRLIGGLAVNTYSGNVAASSSGATTRNIALSGEVTPAPPVNNDCSGAISLTPTSSCSYSTYSNLNATDSGITPSPGCGNYSGGDVWFSVIVPSTGELTIDTNNIDFTDSGMALYSGNCGSLSLIECDDDDSPNGTMSLITRNDLTPGSTVYIRVWEYGGDDSGDFGICVTTPTPCVAPTNQPTNLNFSNITGSTIEGSFTATTADQYLVVVSTSATLSSNPVNGTSYSNGDTIGGGTVVQNSNATTFTATGLSQNTQYYFFIFANNDTSCAGGPTFNTTNPLSGNTTTISGPCLTTSFESGQPSGWTNNSAYFNTGTANTGNGKAGMNGNNDWIRTEQLLDPSDLSFWGRASGTTSNFTINVQYSSDGTNWSNATQIFANGSNSGDITTTYQQFNINLNLTGNYYLRWLMSPRSGGSFYLDDVDVYCGTSTPEPELQLIDNTTTNQNCGFTLDYGSQTVSSNTDLTITISNTGSADLDISSLNITGDYSLVSPPATPFTIASLASQAITIRFTPTTTGTINGTLTINNNDSSEGTCTVNLTGVGFTPSPEINVRGDVGSFPTISDGDVTPQGTDNTLFAAQTIGDSQTKAYRIENTGTANLTVTNIITSGGQSGDFTVDPSIPFPLTISPGDVYVFDVTFSPLAAGVRNTTVEISNNDSDENPYNYAIRGTGNCIAGSASFSPQMGPVGTIVTITDTTGGDDYGSLTTATIKDVDNNDVNMTVTVISASVIQVTIPNNAQTSDIEITNDLGCTTLEQFTVFTEDTTSCEGSIGTIPASWTDLMISGIFDNTSGSCHYLELFNPTGTAITLTGNYEIGLSNNFANANDNMPVNGSTYSFNAGKEAITGVIQPYSTFMIRFGSSGNTCDDCPSIVPDDTIEASGFGVNGNSGNKIDRIFLIENSTNYVDFWANSEYSSAGYVYTRSQTATAPFVPAEYPAAYSGSSNWDSQGTADCFGFALDSFFYPPTVDPFGPVSPSCDLSSTISVNATEGYNSSGDTQELEYQWYYTAPGDTTWTIITSGNSNYSGETTASLTINNVLDALDYQYYCEVREDDATCFSASDATKLNVARTIWNGTAWSNNAPDTSTIAVIDGGYNTSTNGNIEACMLIVNSGNTLAVTNSHYVEVINDVNNSGTITVSTAGAFVQRGVGTAAGSFNNIASGSSSVTKRTSNFDSNNGNVFYTYWSTPVSNPGNAETVFPDVYDNRRYWYNASNFVDSQIEVNNNNGTTPGQDDIDDDGNDWQNANGSAIEVGRGYAVTSALPPTPVIFSTITTFNGEFNTGDISITIYKNNNETADNNWNFIGNPYPSAISAQAFLDANAIIDNDPINLGGMGGALFFWSQANNPSNTNNGNEQVNFSQDDYAIMNGSGGVAGGATSTAPDPYIPSGQGFFVGYEDEISVVEGNTVSNGSVLFTNSMRVTGNNTQFFGANNNSENVNGTASANKLWLNLTSDNGAFGQVCVAYINNATNAYDGWYYDAPRNLSTEPYATTYTIIDGNDDKFAIQGRSLQNLNTDEAFKLGFYTKIDVATIYTYSLNNYEGNFLNNNNIYIIDYYENTIHNLKESDYSFTSEVGEFNDRFEIVFNYEALSLSENELNTNSLVIFEHQDGKVEFKTSENISIKTIEIIDMLGRSIYNLTVKENDTTIYSLPNLSQSTYIANIKLVDGRTISKKLIKQR